MEKIKWGIIGCGDVTEVKSGPAFSKVANSELVAVMRRNADKAQDYAARHRVPKWYSDADELINDADVDAIYIATPPLYHEAYALQAIEAGKPVYVEKPMTVNAAAAQHIVNAAEAHGVKLCVAHYRRQWPLFQKIRSLLEENVLGNIQLITLRLLQANQSNITVQTEDNWRIDPFISGGGLFHDLAPHQLDILFYLFGKPVITNGISLNQGQHYNADDTVSGQIVFKDTILFQGLWSFNAPSYEKTDACEIIGERGRLNFSFFSDTTITLTTESGRQEFPFERIPHVQQPMIEKVVQYFLGKAENPCSGEEGVEVMKMIDAFTKKY